MGDRRVGHHGAQPPCRRPPSHPTDLHRRLASARAGPVAPAVSLAARATAPAAEHRSGGSRPPAIQGWRRGARQASGRKAGVEAGRRRRRDGTARRRMVGVGAGWVGVDDGRAARSAAAGKDPDADPLPSPTLASIPRARAATPTVCLTVTSGGVVDTRSDGQPKDPDGDLPTVPAVRSHSTPCGSLGGEARRRPYVGLGAKPARQRRQVIVRQAAPGRLRV